MSDKLSDEVSALLRCPETQQKLRKASAEELDGFEGDFPEGGFLTEDGDRAYPIQDGFPVLVTESAVRKKAGL